MSSNSRFLRCPPQRAKTARRGPRVRCGMTSKGQRRNTEILSQNRLRMTAWGSGWRQEYSRGAYHRGAMAIPAGTRIGHVHLKVADLERALEFYCGVLGFAVTQRIGTSAAFIAAGGYHHHIGLNTWESKGGHAPAAGTTGLYHLAILYPTRATWGGR